MSEVIFVGAVALMCGAHLVRVLVTARLNHYKRQVIRLRHLRSLREYADLLEGRVEFYLIVKEHQDAQPYTSTRDSVDEHLLGEIVRTRQLLKQVREEIAVIEKDEAG